MVPRRRGCILNVASTSGLAGNTNQAAYVASKHGVVGLTKATAIQYRDKGVRVNAVAPGGTATNIAVDFDPAGAGIAAIGRYQGNVGRIAEADEIAAAIEFLASDAASNITGVVLPVDGGQSARVG